MQTGTVIKISLGVAIVGTVAYALYLVKKNGVVAAGAAVGKAAVDAGAGAVLGIGDALNIPRTNETECEKAKREGRTWDASFVCPALDFLKYAVTPTPSPTPGVSTRGVFDWERNLSWSDPAPSSDPVSDNSLGFNFNYF